MVPKTRFFELVEEYCLDALNQQEKIEFETELKSNSELREEVKFEKEIQTAISEKEVLNLKEKLETVAKQTRNGHTPFDLLEGFENTKQLTETVPLEELLKIYDSLPKAHVYQHELVSNENIYEFYREQEKLALGNEVLFDEWDDDQCEFEGLEEALLEKDILNLRETLNRVTASVREQCSVEEIDRYLSGELTGQELERFEHELKVNSILQREVMLHREMENALLEVDVMNLRGQMAHLMETETSWNVSEQQIEEYIEGTLEGDGLESFLSEWNENAGLRAEVNLRKNVEKAIGEKNIFTLRDELTGVRKELESKETKSLIPETKVHQMHWLKSGVAVAVVLFAFAGLFRNEFGNMNHLYNQYYQTPEWAPQRSVTSDLNTLQEANGYFTAGEYEKALLLYEKAMSENDEKFVYQFYKAASLQNLEKYEEAIPEYSQVIIHGDNMFVDEAEWYRALCYLKTGKRGVAREQLAAIIDKNSFYKNDAKAIIRKMKYSPR